MNETNNTPRKLDYEGADLWMHVDSDLTRLRCEACAKEPETVEWIKGYVEEDDVFYDIGACVGAYSLIAGIRGAKVFAFEPMIANYNRLWENIALNGAQHRVFPLPFALADTTELALLPLSSDEVGSASHGREEKTFVKQPVVKARLDDLVNQFGLPYPDHIKVDVDGFEAQVVDGMPEALVYLVSMMIEVDPFYVDIEELNTAIEDSGLKLKEEFLRESGISNCLYVRSE